MRVMFYYIFVTCNYDCNVVILNIIQLFPTERNCNGMTNIIKYFKNFPRKMITFIKVYFFRGILKTCTSAGK